MGLIFAAWLGAPGVMIGQAAGGVVFGVAALWLANRVIREGGAKPDKREAFFRQSRLFQILYHRR